MSINKLFKPDVEVIEGEAIQSLQLKKIIHVQPLSPLIHIPSVRRSNKRSTPLSAYLAIGRQFHPLCRYSFIERIETGYYYHEKQVYYRTCAIAAAYAGAMGRHSIEQPDFSSSQAIWQLNQRVGYDMNQRLVIGPTGRTQPIVDEMMTLIDNDNWNRAGVVEWLRGEGL